MKNLIRFTLLFLFLEIGQNVLCQDNKLEFELQNTFNGSALGKIIAITEDKYGYLWLADQTNGCILRFDGSRITRYFNDPANTNSLGGYNPVALYADSEGNIWIGYWGEGLDKFDPHTNTFTHYRHNPSNPTSLSNDSVTAMVIDKEGKIWVGTNEGVNLLDESTGKFTHYNHDPADPKSLSNRVVRSVVLDREGTLWIGTGFIWNGEGLGGLNRFNKDTDDFTRYLHDPNDPHSLSENFVRCIYEDSYGNFWVGTGSVGIQSLDRKTGKFTRYPYYPQKPELLSRSRPQGFADHVTFIVEDAARHIWFGTSSAGIVRYDPATKQVDRFKGPIVRNNLIDNTTWEAKALADGTVWISTSMSNFYKTDVLQSKLPNYSKPNSNFEGAMMEEKSYWLCSTQGLIRKEYYSGFISTYPVDGKKPGALGGIPRWVIRDKAGVIWAATSAGLYRMTDSIKGHFERFNVDSTRNRNKPQPSLLYVYEDSSGRLWTDGFHTGLIMINRERNQVVQFKNPLSSRSIGGDTHSMMLEIADGEYMIGSVYNGGLNKFNLRKNSWTRYNVGQNANHLAFDKKGILWAGTNAGLFRYDPLKDEFLSIVSNGKINVQGAVNSIAIDDNDNIWMASASSIFRINADRDGITEFGDHFTNRKFEGFQFNASMAYKGQIYFGCSNGYYFFHPDSLHLNTVKSRIYLSGFWLNNKQLQVSADGPLKESLLTIDRIRMGHNQNTFSFSASVVNFKFPSGTVQYYLEPYDVEWRTTQSEEKIQYYNLSPGKYMLRVRTPNLDGSWATRELAVIIDPPWWRTTWAYIFYALLGLLAIFGIDRYQRRRIREQERLKVKERELEQAREIEKAYHQLKSTQSQLIQAEKMASLGELTAGIAHEIQNPLNFVNNFSSINTEMITEVKESMKAGNLEDAEEMLNTVADNEQKILHHGKRADAIVKGMLQHSRTSTGIKELTDINTLADEYLRLAYHGMRAKDKLFNSDFSFSPDLNIGKINVVPQDIGRVMLNLINNAFYAVHEKKKQLGERYEPAVTVSTLMVNDSNNSLLISVRDNGKGIPPKILDKIFQPFFTTKPTGEGTGLGLSLSYDIVKAHGGDITVDSKPEEGTTFTVRLPI